MSKIFDTMELAKQWRPTLQEWTEHADENLYYCTINEGPDLGKIMVVWASEIEKLQVH